MSLIIFFGMALFIFLVGVAVLSVTFYQWYKVAKDKKVLEAGTQKSVASKA